MNSVTIAVVAKEGLRLEAFLAALEKSNFSQATLQLLSFSLDDQSVVFANKSVAFELFDQADLSQASICVVLESALLLQGVEDKVKQLSCPVLGFYDDLQAFDVQLLSESPLSSNVYGLNHPLVQALTELFSGLDVDSLSLTVFHPVASFGKTAIEELASQTAKLLNVQSVEPEYFHTQMTFNYYPLQASVDGKALAQSIDRDLNRQFGGAEIASVHLQVPVFHGVAMSIVVDFEQEIDVASFIDRLPESVAVVDGNPLSNYEFLQQESMLNLSAVELDADNAYRLKLWFGVDEMRYGYGENMVFAMEKLLKSYL